MSSIGSNEIHLGKSAVGWDECKRVPEIDKVRAENARLKELNGEMYEALERVTEHLENCYDREVEDTIEARKILAKAEGGQEYDGMVKRLLSTAREVFGEEWNYVEVRRDDPDYIFIRYSRR